MRTPEEIKQIFEKRGCKVEIEMCGSSHVSSPNGGGDIFIYHPFVDKENPECGLTFQVASFEAYGNGRHYAVYLVTPGNYVSATLAEYQNANITKRLAFGFESSRRFFVEREEHIATRFTDLTDAFEHMTL